MSLGNRLGNVFYGFAIVLILLGILAIPVLRAAIDVPWLDHIASWITNHIAIYACSIGFLITLFLLERTIGFGEWFLDDLRENIIQSPVYMKVLLGLFLVIILVLDVELLIVNIGLGLSLPLSPSAMILEFGGANAFWALNFLFLIFSGTTIFLVHINAPEWRKIKGIGTLDKASSGRTAVMKRLDPRDIRILKRAETLMEKGKAVKAAKLFERIGGDYMYRAAKIYDEEGAERFAKRAYGKAGDFFSTKGKHVRAGDAYFGGGLWMQAVKSYTRGAPRRYLTQERDRTREIAMRWGEALFNLSHYQEAADVFSRFELHKKAGEAYEKAGDATRAAEAYGKGGAFESSVRALNEGGYSDLADLEKGKMLLERGAFEEAGDAFSLGGNHPEAARAFAEGGAHLKAAESWRKAGDGQRAAECFLAAGAHERALAEYEAMQDFDNAAQLAAHLGLQDKQAEYFEKAAKPIAAARAYLMIDQAQKAAHCLKQVDLDRRRAVAECLQILQILIEQDRLRDAYACGLGLLDGREPNSSLAPIMFHLGRTLTKLGKLKKAFAYLNQAAELVPDQEAYAKAASKLAQHLNIDYHMPGSLQVTLEPIKGRSPEKVVEPTTVAEEPLPTEAAAVEIRVPQHILEAVDDAEKSVTPEPEVAKTAPKTMNAYSDETTLTLDEHTVYDLTQQGELKRYKVVGELGRGGMGYVYKAIDQKLKRPVALKMLHSEHNNDPRVVLFFKREAMAIAALNHPNVVQLFDMGKEQGCFFMVMEYVEGHTLKNLLDRYPDFLRRNLIPIWYQACVGLRYAHDKGIIHRDLKPSNMMWTKERRLKLLDFGLAKEVNDVSKTQQIWGTPSFMAPELLQGERATFLTDLYGLGAAFYMLATGRTPFSSEETAAKFTGKGLPAPPDKVAPWVSPELSKIILKCMINNTDERYGSVELLMQDLKRITKK